MTGADTRFKVGQAAWNKKPWIEKTCPVCCSKFSVKPSYARVKTCSTSCGQKGKTSPMKGRKASDETRQKQREAKLGIRGEAHWNWRGAARSERKRAMARNEYVLWRKSVFERDNYTCVFCGDRGVKLHADHIKPWSTNPESRFEVSNGRALCVPCHCLTPSFPKQLTPKELRNER